MSLALSLRARRILIAATATLLALPTTVALMPAAQAAPLPACPIPGGFEIDGDMAAGTCNPAGDDWNTPNIGVQTQTQTGNYSSSGKDSSATSGWTTSGGTPPKADFTVAYTTARVVNGHYYVYVAWERSSTTGSQGYAIEIDNAATNVATDGTPQPDRSNGGYVFYINTNGGSAPVFGGDCTFTSQATYGNSCSNPTAGFYGAVNTGGFTDPLSKSSVIAGQFYEVGLDITTLTGIAPSCPAQSSIASLYLRSITGKVATSSDPLKGYIAPFNITPNSTCVAPTVDTSVTPGNVTQSGVTGVAPGVAQQDVATITGTTDHPAPTGSVQFRLCNSSSDCTSGGTPIGNPVAVVPGASNSTATSPAVNTAADPLAPGSYCFGADFTPSPVSSNNPFLPASETVFTNECFTVVHGTPALATTVQATTPNGGIKGSLGLTALGDTATLSNFTGDVSGGTVTFNLWGPYTTVAAATCGGTPVFTTTGTLNASGVATTSQTYTPSSTGAGTYIWTASYGGNIWNSAASEGCNQPSESQQLTAASVVVEKDASSSTISAGDQAGFDIKVQNNGTVTATDVTVTDDLPTGLTWQLGTHDSACSLSGNPGSQVLSCTWAQLDPTALTTVAHVYAVTTPANCGVITNTAQISTANGTGNGSSTATVTVECPALSLTKTTDTPTVSAGSPINFTVTVSNSAAPGTGDAHGVTISDPLPSTAGLAWSVKAQSGSACTVSALPGPQTLTCPIGTLAAGASYAVTVTSGTTPASCTVIANTATVAGTNLPSVIPPASASATVLCPDVTITKSSDATAVNAGASIGFTITVANNGAGTASGVNMTDPLPTGSGVSWSVTSAAGPLNCSPMTAVTTLTCTGDLPAGATEVVHVVSSTSYASCGTYDNTASVSVANQAGTIKPASASTSVECAALTIVKTPDHTSPVNVGTDIGYTITITNTGAGDATGVNVTDALPAGPGISWIMDSQTGTLNCSPSTAITTLTCTGNLAHGADEVVHVYSTTQYTNTNGTVVNSCDNGHNGVYNNTAELTWTNGPNSTISSNQATETVLCPDLQITKEADAAAVNVGSAIGFTVIVSNTGQGTALAAAISDPLPSGPGINWQIDSVNGTAANNCAIVVNAGKQSLSCVLGDFASGGKVTVHIFSDTSWTSSPAVNSCANGNSGVYDNTATLSANNAPSVSDSASTAVLCPDVSVVKSADHMTVNVGSQIGFGITVSNGGPGTAAHVTLTDPLPLGPADSGILWTIDNIDGASAPFTNPPCTLVVSNTSQTLTCDFGVMASGATHTVHLVSDTHNNASYDSCGEYPNMAVANPGNAPLALSNPVTPTVECANLTFTKTADASTVNIGDPIGFTVAVSNAGPGTATGATINDPLPSGPGISWSISPAVTGCQINGTAPTQTLVCGPTDLAKNGSITVRVVSDTSWTSSPAVNSCANGNGGVYDNTATLTTTNGSPMQASASTTVQCPDLTFTKTADAATVNIGSQIGFTVAVTNSGAGTATGATINDPLPGGPGVSWIISPAVTGCQINGTAPTQTLVCGPTDLATNGSITVHVVSDTSWTSAPAGTVNSCDNGNGGVYDNTATLTLTNAPGTTASASITVQCPNLTLTKTADASSVSVGSPIGFTIEATNAGPGTATAVTLDDPLPAGPGINWTPDATEFPATCQIIGTGPAAQSLSCNLGDLAPNADVKIHIVSDTSWTGSGNTTVNSCDNDNGGVYDNTATLTPTNAPTLTASADTAVTCPDLVVVKVADAPTTVSAGDTIGFTITATNNGAGTATDVTISDTLPTNGGLSWNVDQTSTGVTCDAITGGVLTCHAGSLAGNGGTATVHLTSSTTPASCGTVTNTASATSGNGASGSSSPAVVTVNCPDVTLTKTPDAATVSAGQQIGFTVTLNNSGSGDAHDVTLSDPLPTGSATSGVAWTVDTANSSGPLTCGISNGTLSCDSGTLAAGATQTIHVVSDTTDASCGAYDNTATASVGNQTPGSLTVGPVTTTVLCATLSLTKVGDSAGSVGTGQQVGFRITATNTGQGTAVAAVLNDPLPKNPGLDWTIDTASTGSNCSITGAVGSQTLNCALGSLAPGDTVDVHIVSGTTDASCGDVNNTAFLTASNATGVQASAQQGVSCPLIITPPPSHSVEATTVPPPLSQTGAGPLGKEIGWGIGLFGLGLLLALAGTRRRYRRAH